MERSRDDDAVRLNRTQRILIAVVVTGAVFIAAIGFAGSYAAVRELAVHKGFGAFATVFPIGVDAGIAVLLALDLLLTWLRIPFPMLRQAAWLLTAATIGFNAAAAWPDPVGVGMHGVIPVLFVVTVEAARHAVGRLAAITADRHMEGVRLWRWLLAPLPTFRLWRRMKLWEIRKYDDVIQAEQQRLVYQARLRGRYGRGWRWKAPVEELLPLRIARYGIPLEVSTHPRSREPEEDAKGVYELEECAVPRTRWDHDENEGFAYAARPERTDSSAVESVLHSEGEAAADAGSRGEREARSDAGPEGEGSLRTVILEPSTEQITPGSQVPLVQQGGHSESGLLPTPPGGETGPNEEELGSDLGGDSTTGEAGSESADPSLGEGEIQGPASAEHESAIERLKSNAAAVRYAMGVLGSTHTPTVVDWLAAHGREVNRGQAHRITKDEEERQQRGQHLTVLKGAS
ncbi:DUF2637 domain-containing protein [Streptomyces sp. NBC_01142]|uniref:DUF2637 domain-containing protein n=1 Tax=Streptomyces sp. NBC_01142 TaxID=2975865 RepID=UPI002250582C|nr:DUF2637 domain-containing protein [Streptomyces sp. NBC_01142]MCX4826579.1 DUF2637 domain-containing protein [Streptomyces sp. NBC_01142]